jgi:alkanesulfonate monooxygenase SsuD/methylene tetrahydromethanopterin reductase-like flavin-dependent oxidoreductase (luciferase family)
VVFPQLEVGADRVGVRDYAQAVEGMGYTHLLAYDHVLGAEPSGWPGWSGPYNYQSNFHEPSVLFGYVAAVAPRLGVVPGVIILPQRQTALVAEQAIEVDLLTGGNFRLGSELAGTASSTRGSARSSRIAGAASRSRSS